MLYTIKEDLELCERFKLSPKQLMFLKIMIGDPSKIEGEQAKEIRKLAVKFQTVFKKCNITPDELSDLISRDILEDYNKPGETFFDMYELSGLWRNKLRLAVYPMPQELFDTYPLTITVQGKLFNGRNASPEDFAMTYLSAIGKDGDEHKKVLEDVEWATTHQLLTVGLEKFVKTRYWDHIRMIREKDSQRGGFNNVTVI